MTTSLIEPSFLGNPAPSKDGERTLYIDENARKKRFFNHNKRVIFINGVDNSPLDHKNSALTLSLLQFCPVIGVYNAKGKTGKGNMFETLFLDLVECILDKATFYSPLDHIPGLKSISAFHALPENLRTEIIEHIVGGNKAAISLFRLARKKKYDIHAHSQGNFITANALNAIRILDGAASMQQRVVHTYGSPCGSWPEGIRRMHLEFCKDPVTLLRWLSFEGVTRSFTGEQVVIANGITHGFLEYLKKDPEFIVKRFESTYQFGNIKQYDEKGLAQWARAQGNNFERIVKVFLEAQKTPSVNFRNLCNWYVYYAHTNLNTRLERSGTGRVTYGRILKQLLMPRISGINCRKAGFAQ